MVADIDVVTDTLTAATSATAILRPQLSSLLIWA